MPPALSALEIGVVTDREVRRVLIALNKPGLAEVVGEAIPGVAVGVLRLGGSESGSSPPTR